MTHDLQPCAAKDYYEKYRPSYISGITYSHVKYSWSSRTDLIIPGWFRDLSRRRVQALYRQNSVMRKKKKHQSWLHREKEWQGSNNIREKNWHINRLLKSFLLYCSNANVSPFIPRLLCLSRFFSACFTPIRFFSFSHCRNIHDDIPLLRLGCGIYHMKHEWNQGLVRRKGVGGLPDAKQWDLQDPLLPPPSLPCAHPLLYSVLPFMNYEIIPNVARSHVSQSRIKTEIFLSPQLRFIRSCARDNVSQSALSRIMGSPCVTAVPRREKLPPPAPPCPLRLIFPLILIFGTNPFSLCIVRDVSKLSAFPENIIYSLWFLQIVWAEDSTRIFHDSQCIIYMCTTQF